MKFKKINLQGRVEAGFVPADVDLELPSNSNLAEKDLHFLVYIPWSDSYLDKIPEDLREFFVYMLPSLRVRTTDVHTAICLGYLDEFVNAHPEEKPNRSLLGVALILHDSGWSRLTEQEIAASLGVEGLKLNTTSQGPKEEHAIKGEEIARETLAKFRFKHPFTSEQVELICKAVRYHDRPEEVKNMQGDVPIEMRLLVDLDHIWSFTHFNFWQDTVRKGVEPKVYLSNLERDLEGYFVTDFGKQKAHEMLRERFEEVAELDRFLIS